MVTGNIPKDCSECWNRHVCGSEYGSEKCCYKDAIEQKPDVVENPQHYKHGEFEVIDEMILAFGPVRTYDFCILNAWKYRARALYKGTMEQDLAKADQYMKMALQIQAANEYTIPPVRLIKYDYPPEAPRELKAVTE